MWAKYIHKEMFPVYFRGKRFASDAEVETESRKWLKQNQKTLSCEIQRTGKVMVHVYVGGYVEKCSS
jgi:hypothetical protein